jgi:streptogrisin C
MSGLSLHLPSREGVVLFLGLMLMLILATNARSQTVPDPRAGAGAEDPELQMFAARDISANLGISEEEARRRLELQDRLSLIVEALRAAMGPDYGGHWYDNEDDGGLRIGVPFDVDPSVVGRLKAVLAASGAGTDARLVGVRWRWSQLEAAQTSLDDRLDGLLAARQVETGLDPKRNAVVVETANDLTAEEAAVVKAALDRTSATAQRTPVQASVLGGVPDDCGWTSDPKDHYYCSNPLRGGPNIFPPAGTSAGCSSGFITRGSDANNYPFILTAGHCLETHSGTWSSKGWPGLLIHSIGTRWSWTASSEGDWGLIRLTNSFWRVGHYVFVSTSPDTPNRNDAYRILRSGDAGRGAFICVSSGIRMGNGYFTDCGEVEMLNVEAGGVRGLSRMTSVCGVDGSSGGPYFKYNRAYGIHWGHSSSLHCVSYHQPVQEAMSKSNVHLEP